MRVFETARIGRLELKNRLLRSATFEGMCDRNGVPGTEYLQHYRMLSSQGLGALITEFASVSHDGNGMQPGQACLENDSKVPAFRKVTEAVHENGGRIILQLAHAGRQTSPVATGGVVYGASAKRSPYFKVRPCVLTEAQITVVIQCFANSARRAKDAGFDGIQLHAAHGYLIHQFLNPAINDRSDAYGLDPQRGIGTAFLQSIIERVRSECGSSFPLLVKVSGGDNYHHGMGEAEFVQLIQFLDEQKVDAIEVSFGTMDHALNIFRGKSIPVKAILRFNPRYRTRNPLKQFLFHRLALPWLQRQFRPFAPMYNLRYALLAKRQTTIPIISVGGFCGGRVIHHAIAEAGIDFVGLSRAVLCEPDFALKVRAEADYESKCIHCNTCAVMCDSGSATRCYHQPPMNLPSPSQAEGSGEITLEETHYAN